jgi:hypothetical protein
MRTGSFHQPISQLRARDPACPSHVQSKQRLDGKCASFSGTLNSGATRDVYQTKQIATEDNYLISA